ncbi:MAG: DUF4129 domain-containing protein [Gemmatimonadota bacterium]|nr:DUF4129 domain-containing protein [Gemmatimonadota bacterium]
MVRSFLQDSSRAGWTDKAIRDTVAAIGRQAAYQREFSTSLWDKILRWIFQRIADLFAAVSQLQYGRLILYSLLVFAVLLIVARLALGIKAERNSRTVVRRPGLSVGAASLMADAERFAAEGSYTRAAHLLFSALVTAGAARGELRLHPSKTTGDYARELRRRNATWYNPFQQFRSRYDRVIFGNTECTADDYDALRQVVRGVLSAARAA